MTAESARHHSTTPGQCSPHVHRYYSGEEQAHAVAVAKSHATRWYIAAKCEACTGWRIRRVT